VSHRETANIIQGLEHLPFVVSVTEKKP